MTDQTKTPGFVILATAPDPKLAGDVALAFNALIVEARAVGAARMAAGERRPGDDDHETAAKDVLCEAIGRAIESAIQRAKAGGFGA